LKKREIWLVGCCALLGIPAFALGRVLLLLIRVSGNFFFHGGASMAIEGPPLAIPAWAILAPALGGLIVGLVARFATPAVRGHGVPEIIETVLTAQSRVPWKVALLKPLCAAISIGSGGPYGAEGPVIGLGGSLGSLLGQWLTVSNWERKVLLSAGAAAGVTAVFGCPVGAALLAVELLLFEFTPTTLMAVGLASTVSGVLRVALLGSAPLFPMAALDPPSGPALAFYVLLGLPLGAAAAGLIQLTHLLERGYGRLPIHWMWHPALGGLAVGLIAYQEPRVLGTGYVSLGSTLAGGLAGQALGAYVGLKVAAWSVGLASGTAGGTLAPLFGIGAGLGALLTALGAAAAPALGLDPRMGALLGMAALFAGASRAVLASILIAVETTQMFSGGLALLGASLMAVATASWLLPHSIMTMGLERRGIAIPGIRKPGTRP